jgi:serine/threonine kinase 16
MIVAIIRWLRWLIEVLQRWLSKRTGKSIVLDSGKRVFMGKLLAEGGFSFVFEAFDDKNMRYALKRILCADREMVQNCRHEIKVHRDCHHHPNVMPLLGAVVLPNECYMLFPYCPQSLRDVVNTINPLLNNNAIKGGAERPWSEGSILSLFSRVCAGVQALHDHGYSHRDIKLENIMMGSASSSSSSSSSKHVCTTPLIMDFGSAGPLEQTIHDRRDLLDVIDRAAEHTSLAYRAPELLEGILRVGDVVDFRAVDVWSLGCTLFALLYGASPFECEFRNNAARLQIIDCTHLSILGGIPKPKGPPVSQWYAKDLMVQLVEPMLAKDRDKRPSLPQVRDTIRTLMQHFSSSTDPYYDDEGIALINRIL